MPSKNSGTRESAKDSSDVRLPTSTNTSGGDSRQDPNDVRRPTSTNKKMDVNKTPTKPKMSATAMNHTPAKMKVTKLVSTLEKDLAEKDEYNQSLEAQVKVLNDLMRNMAGEVVDRESDIENLKKVLGH